jgi:hypothetical protein
VIVIYLLLLVPKQFLRSVDVFTQLSFVVFFFLSRTESKGFRQADYRSFYARRWVGVHPHQSHDLATQEMSFYVSVVKFYCLNGILISQVQLLYLFESFPSVSEKRTFSHLRKFDSFRVAINCSFEVLCFISFIAFDIPILPLHRRKLGFALPHTPLLL